MSRVFLFFKQKTAYEVRISDWSSDVCSSDLHEAVACLALRQLQEAVGVDAVQERGGVGTLHVDLAEGRDVGDADRGAHLACLTHIGLLHRLAGPPVDARTLPDRKSTRLNSRH